MIVAANHVAHAEIEELQDVLGGLQSLGFVWLSFVMLPSTIGTNVPPSRDVDGPGLMSSYLSPTNLIFEVA